MYSALQYVARIEIPMGRESRETIRCAQAQYPDEVCLLCEMASAAIRQIMSHLAGLMTAPVFGAISRG